MVVCLELRLLTMEKFYLDETYQTNLCSTYNIDRKTLYNWNTNGLVDKYHLRKCQSEDDVRDIINLIDKHKRTYEGDKQDLIRTKIMENLEKSVNMFRKMKQDKSNANQYRNALVTPEIEKFICDYVNNNPLKPIKIIKKQIMATHNIELKNSSIYTILHNNNYVFKKGYRINKPSHKKEEHANLKKELAIKLDLEKAVDKEIPIKTKKGFDMFTFDMNKIENIVSIDEEGNHLNNNREYGWFKKCGNNGYKSEKKKSDIKTSTVIAISPKGLICHKTKTKSFRGRSFLDFFKFLNTKINNSIILMDNCSIHKTDQLLKYTKDEKSAYCKNKNQIVFNVPYSPENAPVELINNILKTSLNDTESNSVKELAQNITNCLKKIPVSAYEKAYNHALSFILN